MHQPSLSTAWETGKFLDALVWDQLPLWVWSWGLSVRESNFPFSRLLQISPSVLQVKFESEEDGEQVYGDWDQCSRKLWDSGDLAWRLQCAPLLSTPCQAPAEAICLGDTACPDIQYVGEIMRLPAGKVFFWKKKINKCSNDKPEMVVWHTGMCWAHWDVKLKISQCDFWRLMRTFSFFFYCWFQVGSLCVCLPHIVLCLSLEPWW